MNDKYAEIIAKYYNQGYSPDKIANRISNSSDFDGDWNDIYNEAVRLQDEAKKKNQESGEIQAAVPPVFTSVSSEESSDSLTQETEPVPLTSEAGAESKPDVSFLVKEYSQRFTEDIRNLEQKAINEDDEYGDKIRDLMSDESKSARQRELEVQNYQTQYFDDKFMEVMSGYASEIIGKLPEDADLEEIADQMYEASQGMLAIPLDDDNRYREGNVIWDMIKSAGASAIDLIGGLVSVANSGDPYRRALARQQYGLGEDASYFDVTEAAVRSTSEQFAKQSGRIRETLPQFGYGANGMLTSLGNGNVEDAAYQLGMATGEAIPYIAASLTGGGAAAATMGSVGTINTYINSEREDYNRVQEGLEPVFDQGASGTWQRAGYALTIGSIQAAAGPVEGRIGKVMLGKAALRPGVSGPLTFKGILKSRGIDAGLEGLTEALESGADGVYRSLVGNEDMSASDIAFNMAESFAVGAGVGTVLQAPSTIRDGFRASRTVVTGPQATVNARADELNVRETVRQTDGMESMNRENFRQFLDNSDQTFGEQLQAEVRGREKFYTMLALRYPGTFNTIQNIDIKIESLVTAYNKAKAEGADDATLNNMAGQIYDLTTSRAEITDSYNEEPVDLTDTEQRAYGHGVIDHKIETKKEDTTVLKNNLDAILELEGTELFDAEAHEEAKTAYEESRDEYYELKLLASMMAEADKRNKKEQTKDSQAELDEIENRLRQKLGMQALEAVKSGAKNAIDGEDSEANAEAQAQSAEAAVEEVSQPQAPAVPAIETTQASQITTEEINGRGIDGQFSIVKPNTDGSVSAVPGGPLTKSEAKLINNVSKSLFKIFGDKFRFVVHSTEESGNMADGKGGNEINGYFISYGDGSVEIHLNPTLIRNRQKKTGKDFKKVLAEEVFHSMFSSSIESTIRNNPNAFNSFLSSLESIAKSSGNEDLIRRVQEKKTFYEETFGNDAALLVDESIAEYVAELLDAVDSVDLDQSIIDKIRVAINKLVSSVIGKDAKPFLLSSTEDTVEFLKSFRGMIDNGDIFTPSDSAISDTERASAQKPMRPFDLPDSEFEIDFSYYFVNNRTGSMGRIKEPETMKFRDKWHFVNWYRRARAFTPNKVMQGFTVTIDGESRPLDAKAIDKWKMRPVRTPMVKFYEQKAKFQQFKEFKNEFREIARAWQKEKDKDSKYKSVRENAGRVVPELAMIIDNLGINVEEMSDGLQKYILANAYAVPLEGEKYNTNIAAGDAVLYWTESDYDFVRAKLNEFFNNEESESDVMERGAIRFVRRLDSDESVSKIVKNAEKDLKQALCGLNTGTCSLYSKAFFLQQASNHYRSYIPGKPNPDKAAMAASSEIAFMMEAFGFDPREMEADWIEASQSFLNELKGEPNISGLDVDSFAPVLALLDSYTSSGVELVSNVELSMYLMRQGMVRLSTGSSDFISPDVINKIRNKELEGVLDNVRGERAASMADHLQDINNVIRNYTKEGKFNADKFIRDAKKRSSKRKPAALASMVGKNTEKFANLALGLLGDKKAIPIDLNNIDMFNVFMSKNDIYSMGDEGGLIVPEVRVDVVRRLMERGANINEGSSDGDIFAAISEMKTSEDAGNREFAKKAYRRLVGNNLVGSRDLSAADKKDFHRFLEYLQSRLNAKSGGWTPFSTAQALYMLGKISWASFKDSVVKFKYTDAYNKAKEKGRYKDATMLEDIMDDPIYGEVYQEAAKAEEETKLSDYQRRRYFIQSLKSNKILAHDSQLFRHRTKDDIGEISGEIRTVKNAALDVNQEARYKLVTFQKTNADVSDIKGDITVTPADQANFDGVKVVLDPALSNLFIDSSGRPVKSAEEATVVGNTAFLRGEIEYHDLNSDIVKLGRTTTLESKAPRPSKGPKHDAAVDRYIAWYESNGFKFNNRSHAEQFYASLSPKSIVALNRSEIAKNVNVAMERAAVDTTRRKMRGTADRLKNKFGSDVRREIVVNPENYIIPQKIKDIKADLMDMTDQELIDIMLDDQLVRMSQKQDDLGVLAISELINRAVLKGELDKIPALISDAAKFGTGAGRILRHLRELKKSSPEGIVSTIKSLVEKRGNKLTEEQEKKLNNLAGELFQKQAIVNDLTAKAIRGEDVDAELKKAIEDLKDVERRLDTIGNALIEKGWGDIISTLIVGNLLTPMSQMVNVVANAANMFTYTAGDIIALPVKSAMDIIAKYMGKEVQSSGRKYSISAYMYGIQKFGTGFVEAKDVIATGQERDISEWRISRGLMPIRSIMAAINANELPVGIDGKASMSQRLKLLAQGTFGIPAETMLRLLSLGDLPFRRFIEGIEVYQEGLDLGLEGKALADFIKHPPMRTRAKVAAEGRKLTFQEETLASKAALSMINAMERTLAMGIDQIPGLDGQEFAKVFFRMIVPYRSTPANILSETLTYASPYFGLIKMAGEINKGDTRSASQTIAKMAMGAIVMETAIMLLAEGIISGPVDWFDEEEKNLSFSEGGFPSTSINVSALQRMIKGEATNKQEGDVFFNYMKLGIPGMLMATAAHSVKREDINKEDFGSPVKFVTDAIFNFFGSSGMSAAGAMTEQSFLQGVNEFLQVLVGQEKERSAENLLKSMVSALSATVLPNTASAIYRAERVYLPDTRVTRDMDFAERLAKKFEYTIKDRMFALGEVPIRIDWKGEPIKQTPEGSNPVAYQLFDVVKARVAGSEPVSNEVYRLYEQTGDVSKIVGMPRFASTRVVDLPQIVSKKERIALNRTGRFYSFFDDNDFMEAKVYLNTEQINRLAAVANKQRYNEALMLVNSVEYNMMTDEERINALNDITKDYNGIKEYDGSEFKAHTVLMFDTLQEIYENGEWEN